MIISVTTSIKVNYDFSEYLDVNDDISEYIGKERL